MLAVPQQQQQQAATRPSSRSGSKERDEFDKNGSSGRVESADKSTEKGGRENSSSMGDELNVANDGHMNHLEKSDSEDDEDEPEEVVSYLAFRFFCSRA